MPWTDKSPLDIEWHEGEVPPVEDVNFDCRIILWSDDYIGIIAPIGDNLNPLRWGDLTGFPQWGIKRPTGWWAWSSKGSKPRPADVKTWEEYCAS